MKALSKLIIIQNFLESIGLPPLLRINSFEIPEKDRKYMSVIDVFIEKRVVKESEEFYSEWLGKTKDWINGEDLGLYANKNGMPKLVEISLKDIKFINSIIDMD